MSEEGMRHRSKRPIEPEAVFGNIKFNHGFKRFRLKSTEKVTVEWGLVAIAHNLRKYIGRNMGNNSYKKPIIGAFGTNMEYNMAA